MNADPDPQPWAHLLLVFQDFSARSVFRIRIRTGIRNTDSDPITLKILKPVKNCKALVGTGTVISKTIFFPAGQRKRPYSDSRLDPDPN